MKGRPVQLEEIIAWHQEHIKGVCIKEICKKYKRDYKTIRLWFSKYNISYYSHPYQNPNLIYPSYSEYCKSLKGITEIAKEYNVNPKVLTRGWDYFNLVYKINTNLNKGNNPNHNFFSEINSEIKAYLLGFFAGDGHIEKRNDYDSYSLKLSIHSKDRYILELFNKYIGNNKYNIIVLKSGLIALSITSKQLGLDLKKLGYDNRKTYTNFKLPNIQKKYMRHFLRGFFDADGCISHYTVSFTSYNKSILLDILQYLPRVSRFKLNFRTAELICGNKCNANAWTLEISKKDYLPFIYNYFYKDSNYFLQRKKERFLINKNCSLMQ